MDEAVTRIRTVYSYGLEIPLMAEFTLALDENLKKASVTAIPKGFARCFSQGAMFIGFGFVYYFANRWILMGDVIKERDVIILGIITPMESMLLPIMCMFMLAAGFGQVSLLTSAQSLT